MVTTAPSAPQASFDTSPVPNGDGIPEGRCWREAALALALSVVPGCGHVYAGQAGRGLLWSVLFLLVVVPVTIFLFVAWSFSHSAPLWILLGLSGLVFTVGLGPAAYVLSRSDSPRNPPQPSAWSIGTYAFLVALVAVLESVWLLGSQVETARARTNLLAPVVREEESVRILLCRYIRPVHGDVVLFLNDGSRPLPLRFSREAPKQLLGRVLAVPGDAAAVEQNVLLVNGVELDLSRDDQRREVEKAGRQVRRQSFFRSLLGSGDEIDSLRRHGLAILGDEWSVQLPAETFLVLPDAYLQTADVDEDVPSAWLLQRGEILGRAIP